MSQKQSLPSPTHKSFYSLKVQNYQTYNFSLEKNQNWQLRTKHLSETINIFKDFKRAWTDE